MSVQPPLITDAAPSFDAQQAHRRRTYSVLMAVHIIGFALSYPLYLWQPWVGVVAVALTGVLPWVAVLGANDAPRHAVESRQPVRCSGRARPARRIVVQDPSNPSAHDQQDQANTDQKRRTNYSPPPLTP